MEAAPGRRLNRRRRIPRQDNLFAPGVEIRDQGQGIADSSARVYGCLACSNRVLRGRNLHQLSQVHHGNAVADVSHNRKIVRNEQHRQSKFILQVGAED